MFENSTLFKNSRLKRMQLFHSFVLPGMNIICNGLLVLHFYCHSAALLCLTFFSEAKNLNFLHIFTRIFLTLNFQFFIFSPTGNTALFIVQTTYLLHLLEAQSIV